MGKISGTLALPLILSALISFFANSLFAANEAAPLIPKVLEQEPQPNSTAASPSPEVKIRFDDPNNRLTKEGLLLELDRNDVSALAQFTDHTLVYQSTAPLQPGSHEVKVSGNTKDGTKIQEIVWNFQVAQAPAAAKNWQFGVEPSGTFEYRVRKDSAVPNNHRFNSNIAISSQSTGTVQTNLTSNLQAQDPQPTPVPNEFDLANFQASLTAGNTNFSMGDVTVNYDILSVANLTRRGVFFQQKLPFLSSGFDFYSVRSETIIGFRHGLGVSNSNQRIDGVSYFFAPTKKPEILTFRIYALRGENELDQGFNFGGVTRGSKGNAIGLNILGSTHQNQLRAEGYVAWSNFDFNASDGFSGNKDHALEAKFTYDPAPTTWHNRSSKLLVQLDLQDLGLFFKSLANPFLVSDRRGLNVNSSWTYGTITYTAGISRFHDNVKDLVLLPSVSNLVFSGGFTFTPVSATGIPVWPSLSVTATRTGQRSKGEAVSFLAVHSNVDTIAAISQLTRTKWNLSLNTSYSKNSDITNRVPDTTTKMIGFASMLTPAPSWVVGPSITFTRQLTPELKLHNDLWTYTFTSSIPLRPQIMSLDSQLSLSSTASSDKLSKNSNLSGTAQFTYQLQSFFKTPGKQAIGVRVSYNRVIVDAPFISRQKGLEVFALLDLSWPFR